MATNEKMDKGAVALEPMNSTDPHDMLRAAPKVRIRIHQTGRLGDSADVQAGVNGIIFQMKRGVDILVPEPIMRVLENAVQTVYQWVTRDDGSMYQSRHEVQVYPFTRVYD